jgi:hypothetical protein
MKTMKKPLIGTLLATAVASVILAAPVGAAKPTDSITCTAGLTTLTWISGTTSAVVTWRDGDGSLVGQALVTVITHGPDSMVVGDTPANAATASATFSGRKPAEPAPATCTPT